MGTGGFERTPWSVRGVRETSRGDLGEHWGEHHTSIPGTDDTPDPCKQRKARNRGLSNGRHWAQTDTAAPVCLRRSALVLLSHSGPVEAQ
jgi:hypothetical protein